tara:strand:- start:28527 stop:30542 length:2016 start_codon:yes stop_codon:yes gene_type:complete
MVIKNIIDIQNAKFIVTNTGFFGIDTTNPSAKLQVGNTLYVDDTNGKVGIGIAVPTAQLEVVGSIQIDSAVEARLKFHHSGSSAHALSEITSEQDGTNGGDLHFYTKVDGGNVTEKLRINNIGAIGLGATPDYGTAGQFLKTNNSGSSVSWDTPIDTTYSHGTGISISSSNVISIGQDVSMTANVFFNSLSIGSILNSSFGASAAGAHIYNSNLSIVNSTISIGTNINSKGTPGQFLKSNGNTNAVSWDNPTDTNTTYTNGSNMSLVGTEFNIPQSVATTASPSFNQLTLGSVGNNSGIINLKDATDIGIETVAQMKGILNVVSGGQLEFHTKVNSGTLTKKMAIKNDGTTEIYTDSGTLRILSADGTSQQSFIYNATNGTRDLTIDCVSAITQKGISFQTGGVRRMRITNTGVLTFGASNSGGASNDVLTSSGGVGPPYWAPVASGGSTYTAGSNMTLSPSNQFNIPQSVATNAQPTFYTVSAAAVYGTVANVSMIINSSRGGYGRVVFDTGYAGFQIELYTNEINCNYYGSGTSLYLNYHGGQVYYSGSNLMSDDRVKFNETNITNGLEVIRKLSPEKYTKRLPTETVGVEEAGFIAQEVLAIPELKFAVKHPDKELIPGDPNTRYYAVAYESVFTYAVAGLKELDTIVQKQAQLISSLEARIKTLESK